MPINLWCWLFIACPPFLPPAVRKCTHRGRKEEVEERKWGRQRLQWPLGAGSRAASQSPPEAHQLLHQRLPGMPRYTRGDAGACCSLSSEASLRLPKHLATRLSYIMPGKWTICLPVAAFEWQQRQHMGECQEWQWNLTSLFNALATVQEPSRDVLLKDRSDCQCEAIIYNNCGGRYCSMCHYGRRALKWDLWIGRFCLWVWILQVRRVSAVIDIVWSS